MEHRKHLTFRLYQGQKVCIEKITGKQSIYEKYKRFCEQTHKTPYNRDAFLYEIKSDESKIKQCTHNGYDCIRINKQDFNNWLKEYEKIAPNTIEIIDSKEFDKDEFVAEDSDDDQEIKQ